MLHVVYRGRGYDNMPIVRAAAGVLLAAAAAALSGCAAGLHAEEPAGVNLAGAWKLDTAASDDPQHVLAHMRAEAVKLMSRQGSAPAPQPHAATRGGAQGQVADSDTAALPPGPGGHRPDPLQRSPMAHVITTSMGRGDFLTVRQRPGEFVLDYGTSQRTFTPGAHSVVSAEGGVGDQTSGWKGHEYVIEIKAQLGPAVTESWGLSPDGKHLVQKLHIGDWEFPAVNLTRVYDPTSEIAPRALPTND